MLKNLESPAGESNPTREAFITFDDCIQLADDGLQLFQKIVEYLHRVGEYRYPLGVRKGIVLKGKEVENITDFAKSMMIKGTGRTYFFDTPPAANGKNYLRITESRFQGGKSVRNSLIIFPEDASKFITTVLKMAPRLEQKD